MTFDMVILAAMGAAAVVAAASERMDRRKARRVVRIMRARALRERRRKAMKDMQWDVARYAAHMRWQERPAGVTGVKHPDMAAYIAESEARHGREAKIEIVERRSRA